LVDLFYRGLDSDQCQRVDTFSGGTIADKSPDEAWNTYEELAQNSLHWDDMGTRKVTDLSMPSREPKREAGVVISGSINVAQEFKKLENKIETLLERKLGQFANQRASSPPPNSQELKEATICLICDAHTHETTDCHLAPQYPDFIQEYVSQVGVHKQGNVNPRNDPYSFTYNPGWRNHPNFAPRGNHWENNAQGEGGNYSYGQGRGQGFQSKSQGFNSYQGGATQTSSAPLGSSQVPPGFNSQGGQSSYGGSKPTYGATS
jgi:hypothetical protein